MDNSYVQEIADTIWQQIPKLTKMQIGACERQALTIKVGDYTWPALGFHINPAVGGFIPLDVDVAREPRFKMLVIYNEGADTYLVQRYRLRDEKGVKLPAAQKDWEWADVYFDDFGDVLYRMTTDDPPAD